VTPTVSNKPANSKAARRPFEQFIVSYLKRFVFRCGAPCLGALTRILQGTPSMKSLPCV